MYPINIVARAEGFRRTDESMFPIDIYTGHAILSPLKRDSWVLSDKRMTGATVAPLGKSFCCSTRDSSLSIFSK